jgi:hypothetical protein
VLKSELYAHKAKCKDKDLLGTFYSVGSVDIDKEIKAYLTAKSTGELKEHKEVLSNQGASFGSGAWTPAPQLPPGYMESRPTNETNKVNGNDRSKKDSTPGSSARPFAHKSPSPSSNGSEVLQQGREIKITPQHERSDLSAYKSFLPGWSTKGTSTLETEESHDTQEGPNSEWQVTNNRRKGNKSKIGSWAISHDLCPPPGFLALSDQPKTRNTNDKVDIEGMKNLKITSAQSEEIKTVSADPVTDEWLATNIHPPWLNCTNSGKGINEGKQTTDSHNKENQENRIIGEQSEDTELKKEKRLKALKKKLRQIEELEFLSIKGQHLNDDQKQKVAQKHEIICEIDSLEKGEPEIFQQYRT